MSIKINLNTNPITFNSKTFQQRLDFKFLTKEEVAAIIHPYMSDHSISSEQATKKIILELEKEFKSEVDIHKNKEEQILDLVRAYRKNVCLETIAEKITEVVSSSPWDLNNSGMF